MTKTPLLIVVLLLAILFSASAEAETYIVGSLADDGDGTLRWAIGQATTAGDTIDFTVSGTIALLSPLPSIDNRVTFTSLNSSAITLTGGTMGSSAALTIDSGGDISIGAGAGMPGTSSLDIGSDGTGILNITDGGTVNSTSGYIAGNSTGTVTVDGAGSTWTNSGELYVGDNEVATLNIKNGGAVSNTNGYITYDNSHPSTVNVDGAGSTWTNNGALSVGSWAAATLNITNGGTVTDTIGYLSDGNGGSHATGSTATVDGAGSKWINSEELYVGDKEVATLNIKNGGAVSAGNGAKIIYVSYDSDGAGTINIGGGAGTTAGTVNALNITGDTRGITGVINFNHDNASAYTFSTPLLANLRVEQKGPGTTILTGANTYTGGTTITAGTLTAGSTSALGAGDVDNNSGGALDVGTTNLGITGTYTQASGSTLKVTMGSTSTSGKITTGEATVNAGSSVYVTIGTNIYVPNNTTFTIINTGGAGVSDLPGTITSTNRRMRFTPDDHDDNLELTTSRVPIYFADLATNSNQIAVGTVLDGITNPTGDMATVLSTMESLSNAETVSAMNSMLPDTSGAILQISQRTLDQLTAAILSHQEYLRNNPTGVSTGDDMYKGLDVWAQGYGSYLHQDPRQLSQGYNASIWGTALGFDIPLISDIRIGACFGFAQDYIRGKDNSNRTNVNAYQWTIYGEYSKDAFYLDLSGAFAFNTYDASRQINVGPGINRTASADYNGEQYQVYVEGGYTLGHKKLNITPLASFQYQHLYLQKYTESGAGALDLTVKQQNYDLAQTGLGVKLDYPMDTKYGRFVPELRVKWLYDWIGDAQQTASAFSGGGASFATNGFDPAQSAWDFGVKLTMFTNNSWILAANYDFELKDDFYGHYGYGNAKYSF